MSGVRLAPNSSAGSERCGKKSTSWRSRRARGDARLAKLDRDTAAVFPVPNDTPVVVDREECVGIVRAAQPDDDLEDRHFAADSFYRHGVIVGDDHAVSGHDLPVTILDRGNALIQDCAMSCRIEVRRPQELHPESPESVLGGSRVPASSVLMENHGAGRL